MDAKNNIGLVSSITQSGSSSYGVTNSGIAVKNINVQVVNFSESF